MKTENIKITLGFLLICIIWGSTWLVIKLGLNSFTVLFAGGLRFISAAILFYIILTFRKVEIKKDWDSIKLYIILGVFSFFIPFALVYWAEQYIASGLTSILFGILPFFIVIFSRIILPENRIGISQWFGILLGFLGLVVIFSENLQLDIKNDFWGMMAVFSSAIIQAVVSVYMKKHSQKIDPLSLNLFPALIAGVLFLITAFLFEDINKQKFNPEGIFSILYLALIGTVTAFSVYYWLMKRISVVILSLNSFVSPIVAVTLGWIILSEQFSARDLIGSSFVLIGILFANFDGLVKYFRTKSAKFKL